MRFGQTIIFWPSCLVVLILSPVSIFPRSNEFIRYFQFSAEETPGTNTFVTTWGSKTNAAHAAEKTDHNKPDYAPIVERKLDFYDFRYPTIEGSVFDLREYLKGKSLIVIE